MGNSSPVGKTWLNIENRLLGAMDKGGKKGVLRELDAIRNDLFNNIKIW